MSVWVCAWSVEICLQLHGWQATVRQCVSPALQHLESSVELAAPKNELELETRMSAASACVCV